MGKVRVPQCDRLVCQEAVLRLVLLYSPSLKFPRPLRQGGGSAGNLVRPGQLDVPRNPAVVSDLPVEGHVLLVPVGADPPCHTIIMAHRPLPEPCTGRPGTEGSIGSCPRGLTHGQRHERTLLRAHSPGSAATCAADDEGCAGTGPLVR